MLNYIIALGWVSVSGLVVYRYRFTLLQALGSLFRKEDLRPIGKNLYELTYYHKNKPYRLMMQTNARPKLITRITTSQGEDVSHEVMPILGPNQDFHRLLYLPDGLSTLVFETRYGTTKTFHQMFERNED